MRFRPLDDADRISRRVQKAAGWKLGDREELSHFATSGVAVSVLGRGAFWDGEQRISG
jgi:hypothetical protein